MRTPTLTGSAIVAEALARLAIARGSLLDEVTADVYLDALADLDPDLVARSCRELGLAPREEVESAVPEVGKIRDGVKRLVRDDAMKAAAARLLPMPKGRDDEPRYFCVDCLDETSGWRTAFCFGEGQHRNVDSTHRDANYFASHCGRRKSHEPHTFVDPCHCHPMNPVAAERRSKERRLPAPTKKGRSS